ARVDGKIDALVRQESGDDDEVLSASRADPPPVELDGSRQYFGVTVVIAANAFGDVARVRDVRRRSAGRHAIPRAEALDERARGSCQSGAPEPADVRLVRKK